MKFHIGWRDWQPVYEITEMMGKECSMPDKEFSLLKNRAKTAREKFLAVQGELGELYRGKK